ncbi:unnamed protein product [Didymodactylos carnosus]|uniref:Uncharacterized protein n=1 Tax=Didymodactylos carnosus TaxID=1234261 RepID=A0A814B7T6_9BILA|nr:unnamed protein product [Didymodactylos carnosus]CAF1119509.1 unnamed protein product [Didymodactylos carnosus]CAF3702031.1 unnamed protein product [Didymodactylos carnosus]CAF3892385.1 unnamed protein product [Didymodactylos carnosus]
MPKAKRRAYSAAFGFQKRSSSYLFEEPPKSSSEDEFIPYQEQRKDIEFSSEEILTKVNEIMDFCKHLVIADDRHDLLPENDDELKQYDTYEIHRMIDSNSTRNDLDRSRTLNHLLLSVSMTNDKPDFLRKIQQLTIRCTHDNYLVTNLHKIYFENVQRFVLINYKAEIIDEDIFKLVIAIIENFSQLRCMVIIYENRECNITVDKDKIEKLIIEKCMMLSKKRIIHYVAINNRRLECCID